MNVNKAQGILSSPYRGIHPFRYVDHPCFFGRTKIVDGLLAKVLLYRLVLFFGESGTGKSSVINAGLIPAMEKEGFCAERLRVRPFTDEPILVERIQASDGENSLFLPSIFCDEKNTQEQVVPYSLDRFLSIVHDKAEEAQPVLIFDQFEELFTLFGQQESTVEQEEALQAHILELIIQIVNDTSLKAKVIIVVRDDFLGKLEILAGDYPRVFENRVRLQHLDQKNAIKAIVGPFEDPNPYPSRLTTALAEEIVQKLAHGREHVPIHSTELQIVCSQLWDKYAPTKPEITPDEFWAEGRVEGIIEGFLKSELVGIRPPALRPRAITILNHLITESGTRDVVSEDRLLRGLTGLEKDTSTEELSFILEYLEKRRLVYGTARRETYFYELANEYLIRPILKEKRQIELKGVAEVESSEKEQRWWAGLFVFLFILVVVAFTFFIRKSRIKVEQQHLLFIKLIQQLEQDPDLKISSDDLKQEVTSEDIRKYFNLKQDRWWNYYARGLSYLAFGHYEHALADFAQAISKRSNDEEDARTYGMNSIDYFPHRESGIALYFEGKSTADIAIKERLFSLAVFELEKSLQQEESSRAKLYVTRAKEALWKTTQEDTTPPTIHVNKSIYTNQRTVQFDITVTDYDSYVTDVRIAKNSGDIRIDKPRLFIEFAKAVVTETVELTIGSREKIANIVITASDLAGNISDPNSVSIILDTELPKLTYREVKAQSDGRVTTFVQAQDDFGLKQIQVGENPNDRLDCEGAITYSGFITGVSKAGELAITAVDNAGNTTITDVPVASSVRIQPKFDFPPHVLQLGGKETSQDVFYFDGTLLNAEDVAKIMINVSYEVEGEVKDDKYEIDMSRTISERQNITFSQKLDLTNVPENSLIDITVEAYRQDTVEPCAQNTMVIKKRIDSNLASDAVYGILLLPFRSYSTANALSAEDASTTGHIYDALLDSLRHLHISDQDSNKRSERFNIYDVNEVGSASENTEWYTLEEKEYFLKLKEVIRELQSRQASGKAGEPKPSVIDLVIDGQVTFSSTNGEKRFEVKLRAFDVSTLTFIRFPGIGTDDLTSVLADVYGRTKELKKYIDLLAFKVGERFPRLQADIIKVDLKKEIVEINRGKRNRLFPQMKVWFYRRSEQNTDLSPISPGKIINIGWYSCQIRPEIPIRFITADYIVITK